MIIILLATATPARMQSFPSTGSATTIHLPLIMHRWPPPPSIFGAEINPGRVSNSVGWAREAQLYWIRYNGILWSEVEPTPGEYRWSGLASVESELRALHAQGLTPMVVVRGTPGWAQQLPQSLCGPIRADAWDDFARFMYALVARYSGPPYNVTRWEIWNEPDAPAGQGDPPYGCWGDPHDAYYGGRTFGAMLRQVYPAIKSANPTAQVVLGGLLLDCDPQRPPPGNDCRSAHFLEGVLLSGAGQSFDLLAFHGYPFWDDQYRDWDRYHRAWHHRGGVVLGKADFLRSVLQRYGVSKPMIMNEGGLLCWNAHPACQATFYDAQANYLVRLYTRTWAGELVGAIWYTLDGPGWNLSGLLDANQQPKPAYQALQFMAGLLQDSEYVGALETSPSVEGYQFRRGTSTYWIYWTNDNSTVTRSLPPNARAVYNKFGRASAPGSSITVGFEPVFIEIGP
ncbi:hypothetical protein [Kallotenue papyrolyticum]|uniref:hypothetical protein n=1 Tax=Kallotenue papyrolyticum TaxID=1325125 RepID=UPI001268FBCD|nr:hypothetical protein [Kallotenue papyrolyticum]